MFVQMIEAIAGLPPIWLVARFDPPKHIGWIRARTHPFFPMRHRFTVGPVIGESY